MLFLLVMLTSGQLLVRTKASELSNAILNNVSNERPQDSPSPSKIDYQKSPGASNTGNKTLAANGAKIEPKAGDFLYHSSTIDLVLKNDSSRKYGSIKSQLDRHSYKINPSEQQNVPPAWVNSTFQPEGKSVHVGQDELKSSESSMNYLLSSRSDEGESDHPSMYPDENNQAPLDDDKVFAEKSSSNMSEQKVVKELTKILSKGMSGATDQMKLDTLENWKRRQKENKMAKDKRAKLFEDLLTAAIESHPERSKVKSGKRRNKKRGPKLGDEGSKSLTGLINDPSVDEDLAADAEGVVHSLQNLVGSSQLTGQDDAYYSGVEDASLSNNDESESNENNHDNEEKESKKSSTNERPIVKQFKKIKQRISQRRKQLDHIKKMFNVELALNPNDGSLMGKSVAKSKTKKEPSSQYEEADDSNLETGGSASGKKTNKSAKMTELLNYLKENPEILASVMDELSEDAADSKASLGSNSDILNPFVSSSISDQSEPSFIGSSSRRKTSSVRQQEPEMFNWSRSRGTTASKKIADMSLDLPDNLEFLSTRRQRPRNSVDAPINGLYQTLSDQTPTQSTFSKVKSAEALLLESLRERQLMNLARLERVLAERQQASSNRSSVYSALNTQHSLSYAKQGDQMMAENERNDQRSDMSNRKAYQDEQKGSRSSNEEVVHHFLVMNNSMPSSSGSQISGEFISNQQPYHKSVSQLPKQNEQWVARSQQRYPLLQSNNNENRNNLINQQQQHNDLTPSLNRFKSWRDASQSEASSSNARTRLPFNASLFTGGDLTSDSTSSLVGQNGIYNDRYREQAKSRSYDQRETDSRFESPTGGFRDYADSIVTKPGPFLLSVPQPGYQQSATSSVFMTRSSAGQGEQYPTVKPAYASDFDRRYDSTRSKSTPVNTINDSEKKSIKDDERIEREKPVMQEQNLRHPSAPVDYFSAYKQELSKDDDQPARKSRRVNVQRLEPTERPETTDESNEDDMGAIWAK